MTPSSRSLPRSRVWSDRCSDRLRLRHHQLPNSYGLWSQRVPGSRPLTGHRSQTAPESGLLRSSAPTSPERRAEPVSRPASRDHIERLAKRLSQRDHAILTSLQLHHFLTTGQLQQLHFGDHDSDQAAARICRRSLARLRQWGIIEHLERRVGGIRAGSAAYIWRIGLHGDRLLRLRDPSRARSRRKEPSLRFLDHCLAVADAHLTLRTTTVDLGGELLRLQGEPTCWRRFLRPAGQRDILKPDFYAVTTSGQYEDHWFIEVDRATESLPTLLRKCQQYQDYRRSGREQERLGIFPKVLWLVPDQLRADKLRRAIEAASDLNPQRFVIGTLGELPAIIRRGAE